MKTQLAQIFSSAASRNREVKLSPSFFCNTLNKMCWADCLTKHHGMLPTPRPYEMPRPSEMREGSVATTWCPDATCEPKRQNGEPEQTPFAVARMNFAGYIIPRKPEPTRAHSKIKGEIVHLYFEELDLVSVSLVRPNTRLPCALPPPPAPPCPPLRSCLMP